jgi:hypothetical protein
MSNKLALRFFGFLVVLIFVNVAALAVVFVGGFTVNITSNYPAPQRQIVDTIYIIARYFLEPVIRLGGPSWPAFAVVIFLEAVLLECALRLVELMYGVDD